MIAGADANIATSTMKLAQSQAGAGTLAQSAGAIKGALNESKDQKATAAAKDFEAVFIGEMLKPLFDTVEVDETFGGGHGEEVFRGMMVQQYGKMIANNGGIGIASHVKAELLKHQEKGVAL